MTLVSVKKYIYFDTWNSVWLASHKSTYNQTRDEISYMVERIKANIEPIYDITYAQIRRGK